MDMHEIRFGNLNFVILDRYSCWDICRATNIKFQ